MKIIIKEYPLTNNMDDLFERRIQKIEENQILMIELLEEINDSLRQEPRVNISPNLKSVFNKINEENWEPPGESGLSNSLPIRDIK